MLLSVPLTSRLDLFEFCVRVWLKIILLVESMFKFCSGFVAIYLLCFICFLLYYLVLS